ncbi:MAG: hypothetical protein IJ221_07175 [Oscillibacter sp.]|nr:hypothetical protein [Oscillibacter sp.]
MKRGRRQRRRRTSHTVLLALGVFLLAFITCMVVTFWMRGAVPDTLIQYTLGAGGVEALVLAAIRVSKVVSGQQSEEREENEDAGLDPHF